MNPVNEQLKNSCTEAVAAFRKLNSEKYTDIQAKLEWCIGSYSFDKNPAGLHEFGVKSLDLLKKVKTKEPRKVNKKVIDALEKALFNFSKN